MPRRGRRLVWLGLLAGASFLAAALVVFLWPRPNGPPTHFSLGSVDEYDVGSITTVANGKFHLVRVSENQFVALSWREPGHGCTAPWRPTFAWPDPETGLVTTGWFRDPCRGSTFDKDGTRVFGPALRNMDRYVVSIVGGRVEVDTAQYVCGWSPPGARCAGATPAP